MTTSHILVFVSLSAIAGIVGALWGLGILLCREWVKTSIRSSGGYPLQVRYSSKDSWDEDRCSFRVRYQDAAGIVHRARCWTFWHRPSVTWVQDEIETAEYPDAEPLRRANRRQPPRSF